MAGEEDGTCSFELQFPPFTVPVRWFPPAAQRGAAVILPAMGTPARWYEPLAADLQNRGFGVFLPELPGTGASQPRPSRDVDFGYPDLVERYLPLLLSTAREQSPDGPLVAVGHSLGGQLAAFGVIHGHADLDAVITVAAGHIHFRHWRGAAAAKVLFAALLFPFLTRLFGYLPGQRVGFGGPQASRLIREWSRTIRTGRLPEISGPRRAPEIPALSIAYEGDFLAPMASVEALAGLLNGVTSKLPVNWPGPPHSSWTRYPDSTARAIDRWLTDRAVVPHA